MRSYIKSGQSPTASEKQEEAVLTKYFMMIQPTDKLYVTAYVTKRELWIDVASGWHAYGNCRLCNIRRWTGLLQQLLKNQMIEAQPLRQWVAHEHQMHLAGNSPQAR